MTKHGFLFGALMAVAMTAMAAMACSAAGSVPPVVTVDMNEFSMRPSLAAVQAGTVTFKVVNHGAIEHEMVILKTNLSPKDLVMQANGAKMDEAASGKAVGEVEGVEIGQTKTGTFTLEPGHYVLVCNEPEHYKQGMAAAFDVK